MVLVRYNTIFHLLLYVWFGTILFRVNHLFSHPSVNRDVFTVDKVISFFTKESTHAGYIFWFTDSSRRVLLMVLRTETIVVMGLYPARRNRIDCDMELGK